MSKRDGNVIFDLAVNSLLVSAERIRSGNLESSCALQSTTRAKAHRIRKKVNTVESCEPGFVLYVFAQGEFCTH